MFKFILKAILVEGVLAEEVNGWQTQPSLTHTAFHHLKYLSTEGECGVMMTG